jgi:hypothetical protein
MVYRVRLSTRAAADAERIYQVAIDQAPMAGQKWYNALFESLYSLNTFPQRCPIVETLSKPGSTVRKMPYGRKPNRVSCTFGMARAVSRHGTSLGRCLRCKVYSSSIPTRLTRSSASTFTRIWLPSFNSSHTSRIRFSAISLMCSNPPASAVAVISAMICSVSYRPTNPDGAPGEEGGGGSTSPPQ